MVNANTSAVTILLPSICEDVDSPVATLQWAVTGYSLVGAAVIVTSGALGDVLGRRKIFLGGLLLFIGSCAFIALSRRRRRRDRRAHDPGRFGRDDPRLRHEPAVGRVVRPGADEGDHAVGRGVGGGRRGGPLVGGVLVDTTGWQGLFWIDAAIAALCIPVTIAHGPGVARPGRARARSTGPARRSIAVALAPVILALSEGTDWGWTSAATLGSLRARHRRPIGFFYVEGRVEAPLVDLKLLRNRVLVGATLAILIVAGTINGLMYVLSLYFQNPEALGMSAFEAGLATLPAAAAMIAVTPAIAPLAAKLGGARAVALGFLLATAGFASSPSRTPRGSTSRSCSADRAVDRARLRERPGVVGLDGGRARRPGRRRVRDLEHGPLRRRRRGCGGGRDGQRRGDREPPGRRRLGGEALAAGLAASALLMAVWSASGVAARRPPARATGREHPRAIDRAAAAAATTHTIPTQPSPARVNEGARHASRSTAPRRPWAHGAREGRPRRARRVPVGRGPQAVPARGVRQGRRLGGRAFAAEGLQDVRPSLTPDGSHCVHGHVPGARGRADRAPLLPLRRAAAARRGRVGRPGVRADRARRPLVRPRQRRLQGQHRHAPHRAARAARGPRRLPVRDQADLRGLRGAGDRRARGVRSRERRAAAGGHDPGRGHRQLRGRRPHAHHHAARDDEHRRQARGARQPDALRHVRRPGAGSRGRAHPAARLAARRGTATPRSTGSTTPRRGTASTTPPSSSAPTPTCSTASS